FGQVRARLGERRSEQCDPSQHRAAGPVRVDLRRTQTGLRADSDRFSGLRILSAHPTTACTSGGRERKAASSYRHWRLEVRFADTTTLVAARNRARHGAPSTFGHFLSALPDSEGPQVAGSPVTSTGACRAPGGGATGPQPTA